MAITEEEVRERLRAAIEEAGSRQAWGDQYGVGQSEISEVLSGARVPGRKMRAALGVELMRPRVYREAGSSRPDA